MKTAFITAAALPGAGFNSYDALRDNCHDAIAIERILANFAQDGDECALSVDLERFGFNAGEIAAIVARPHVRPRVLYAA